MEFPCSSKSSSGQESACPRDNGDDANGIGGDAGPGHYGADHEERRVDAIGTWHDDIGLVPLLATLFDKRVTIFEVRVPKHLVGEQVSVGDTAPIHRGNEPDVTTGNHCDGALYF